MIYKFFKYDSYRGFSLIEAMLAVTILTMVTAGPVAIASRSLRAATIAKDQTIALYLAQDAVEYIRFVKDSNKLAGQPWLAGLDGTANGHTFGGGDCVSSDGSAGCYVNSMLDAITSCVDATCPIRVKYDTATGYYNYVTGDLSSFTRSISIVTPVSGAASEAAVTVVVSWRGNTGGPTGQRVVLRQNIYDWQ